MEGAGEEPLDVSAPQYGTIETPRDGTASSTGIMLSHVIVMDENICIIVFGGTTVVVTYS